MDNQHWYVFYVRMHHEKDNQHWYVFYVRMHHEKKTAEKLANLGVTYYLPVQEVTRQWSDRKKKLKIVVIPMMIFVKADEVKRVELLRDIPAITGSLIDRTTGRPAIIRDDEMKRFMFMLDYSEEAVHFIGEPLQPGTNIEVVKGPLSGLRGELLELNGKSHVVIRISQLGCASIEVCQKRAISPINNLKKTERTTLLFMPLKPSFRTYLNHYPAWSGA